MARSLQKLASCLLPILLIQSTLPSLAQADNNGSLVDQSAFTNFELFKNTRLQPCAINVTATNSAVNATATGRRVTPRDPRGGGGRGGGSSGGSRGGGTYGGEFIEATWVGEQNSFCSKLKGTPVMIPATPTQYAFTPWWPTFTAQFVSLIFTWVGLWWTTKTVEREGATDMKLPILFWIQLPIDMARILAWFVKTFHGFAVAQRFSWVSVILWLVPFNYIWLVRLIDAKKRSAPLAVFQRAPAPTQYGQAVDYSKVPHVEEGQATPAGARSKWFFISLLFGALTAFMWLLSLIVVGLHFKYSWFDSKHTHPTYVQASKFAADASSIAHGLPDACIMWAKNNANTINWQILDLRIIQVIQVLIVAIQFVVCTVVVIFKQGGRHHILGKLRVSAIAVGVSLVLPAIGTGCWILGSVTFGKQDEWMKYTNNLSTTGGCTFVAVAMSRQWGYWDVEYERGFRIAMSLLGAA